MIAIFDADAKDWTTNGLMTLWPTECTVEEVAGGKFELTLTHPLTDDRRWRLIKPEYLVRAPIPVKRMNAIDGIHEESVWEDGAQLWKVTENTELYSKPAISYRITYSAWIPNASYVVGQCVTYANNNYRCALAHGGVHDPPTGGYGGQFWTRIANWSDGGSVVLKVKTNEQIIVLSSPNDSWKYCRTMDGVYGYIQNSKIQYIRDLDPSDVDIGGVSARVIRDQMFRIYKIDIQQEQHTIQLWARHISYDFARNLLTSCDMYEASTARCLITIQGACVNEDTRTMATNIPAGNILPPPENPVIITQDWSGKNPISALLDPDTGLVPLAKAQLVRDNDDIFVLANAAVAPTYRISYGVNMTGIQWEEDTDEVVTRIIPVGKAADGSDLVLPEVYVDSDYITDYAVIRCEHLKVNDAKVKEAEEGSEDEGMTEEEAFALMRKTARERFSKDECDREKLTLKVSFINLGDTEEYAQYRKLAEVALYDFVQITDPPLGLTVTAQVTGYKWDAIRERYIEITVGDPFDYQQIGAIPSYEISAGAVTFTKLSADAIRQIKKEVSE